MPVVRGSARTRITASLPDWVSMRSGNSTQGADSGGHKTDPKRELKYLISEAC